MKGILSKIKALKNYIGGRNFPEGKVLLTFTLIGLLIRIGFTLFQWQSTGSLTLIDSSDYIEYARAIMKQGPLVLDPEGLKSSSGPGFPWLLALLFSIFGENNWMPVSLNILLSTAIIPLIYLIGKSIFSKSIGIMAAFWSIFYIPFFLFSGVVMKENVNLFLFTFLFLWLIYIVQKPNYPIAKLFAFAFTFVYFLHTDERYLPHFFIFLTILLLMNKLSKESFKRVMVIVSFLVLLMAPWLIRNYHVHERPVILTERASMITDKLLGYEEENEHIQRNTRIKKSLKAYRDSLLAGYNPEPRSGRMRNVKKGIEKGFKPHTFDPLTKYWKNFLDFWEPIRTQGDLVKKGWIYEKPRTFQQNLIYTALFGILLPFLLVGMVGVFNYRHKWGIAIVTIILLHTVMHVYLGKGVGRYRFPIDPLVLVMAFYGLTITYQNCRKWLLK